MILKTATHIFLSVFAIFFAQALFSQYPQYFTYDNENGLPSNEVYSIAQDQKGFIWIGCDAGMFKFDGVRYIHYKSKTQNSKSISNLTVANEDRIYCMNFQNQIFYLERDTLRELRHTYQNVSNITVDQNGLLYVDHVKGISVFHPKTNNWKTVNGVSDFTRSVTVNNKNEVYFLSQKGLGIISGNVMKMNPLPDHETNTASLFLLMYHQNNAWVFKRDGTVFFTLRNGTFTQHRTTNLNLALQNRKITNLKSLPDGKLWIATYNGIICYDAIADAATIFYPELAFSDVLIDREGNYWFTSLHTGILRVPDLNYLVWNDQNPDIKNEKLTQIVTDGIDVYFSAINGTIGRLNTRDNTLETFHTGKNADIECLIFDAHDQCFIFNSQNQSHKLKNDKLSNLPFQTNAIKAIIHIPPFYFLGTSMGLYVENKNQREKISDEWTRQLVWNTSKKRLYAATNKGLQIFSYKENFWTCIDTLFEKTQIISIDFDETENQLYVLTFDGKVRCVNKDKSVVEILELPENVQATKMKYHNNKLYLATNNGIAIYEFVSHPKQLNEKGLKFINRLTGLASDNVQDILILDGVVWAATGKGLQKIPLNKIKEKSLAKIYLKNHLKLKTKLDYGEVLILNPETSIYSSNGNFEYAYRINKSKWIKLPATIKRIEIQNLPERNYRIELKAIDHLGRDSENCIVLIGYVNPPFYKTWWFILLIGLLLTTLIWLVIKRRIEGLKQKQAKEIERLTLENNLRLTQQSALKAQMNPHFIFNVLNSIKGYIYENDKKNAALYLSRFSGLIRKILEQSSVPKIQLQEEIETLKLYIELEEMLLDGQFEYEIIVSEDCGNTQIPALLIQPFVENAFKHGLRHKKGAKKLIVIFSSDEKMLTVTIEDNGIGRDASATINQKKTHQPFSSLALEQRIRLLNIEEPQTVGLDIVDMKDSSGNATGTKVILNIKLDK